MRVVDLFAGCGGLSLGFEAEGYDVCLAVELWDSARKVYQKNFNHPVVDIDLSSVVDACNVISPYNPDIIIGGPPCQEFSMAGARVEGERAKLTFNFSEIICNLKPNWFLLENVPGIKNSATWKESRDLLKQHGYGITEVVLNAAFFGVPQNRKRFFAIGHLNEEDNFIKELVEKKKNDTPMTIREYADDRLEINFYYRHPRNWGRKGIFSVDEPAPTVRSTIRQVPPGYKAHPDDAGPLEEARALNTEELALIQTFPKDFVFLGTKTAQNTMIANAVPVELSRHIAHCILEYEYHLADKGNEEFKIWLENSNNYTKRTAGNIISRLKRISHIIPSNYFNRDYCDILNKLEMSSLFKSLTPSVKSQIKKAIQLKIAFLNR
ncbi:DNA cytosine methyltransferase [Kluyvera georgiana]|uniref:DNA cytosine methyltransferase n=1 Tax=Kluyvera georgiana TaxID=73098 RepID=UPI00321FD5E2